MRAPLASSALLVAVLGTTQAVAEPRPSVRWLVANFPPVFIVDGQARGQGYADIAQRRLIEALGQYHHEILRVPANLARIDKTLQTHPDMCFSAFLKTPERSERFAFSQPYRVMLPIRLYVPDSSPPPVLDAQGEVDLDQVLGSSGLRLGVIGGRSYGEAIDNVLARPAVQRGLYRRLSEDQLAGLMDMMQADGRHIDAVLAYPDEIAWLSRERGAPVKVRGYPIKGSPDYLLGYIGCSGSEQGRRIIADIDKVLAPLRPQLAAQFLDGLPAEDVQHYRQAVQQAFGLHLASSSDRP